MSIMDRDLASVKEEAGRVRDAAKLIEPLPSMHKALWFPSDTQTTSVVAQGCNPSIYRREVRKSSLAHSEFEASLGG